MTDPVSTQISGFSRQHWVWEPVAWAEGGTIGRWDEPSAADAAARRRVDYEVMLQAEEFFRPLEPALWIIHYVCKQMEDEVWRTK